MTKDGGQAFPSQRTTPHSSLVNDASQGMTLRDYFAGQVLIFCIERFSSATYDRLAKDCYLAADAMIVERNKG